MSRGFPPHAERRAGPPARPTPFLGAFRFALLALALGGVLLWSGPAEAQTATVLVKNTGQGTPGVSLVAAAATPKDAQAFTTGSNATGYTLSSIGISFDAIDDPSTAGSELTVTLNGLDISGLPGNALCTLSDPATFTASSVNTFDAPTTVPCPTLTANTIYYVVIERANINDATKAISYKTTLLNAEDSGGATGWSIEHATRYPQSPGPGVLPWGATAGQSMLIEVKGAAPNNPATGAPSISGVLQENEELTADTAGIADEEGLGTFSYQWLAGGTAISGATSATYTLQSTEVGDAISLTVTFTDGGGHSESVTSAATDAVVASGATRELLWLATLRVHVSSGDAGYSPAGGNLSPAVFSFGGTTYTVSRLDSNTGAGVLSFNVHPAPGTDEVGKWLVSAAGSEFPLDGAETVQVALTSPAGTSFELAVTNEDLSSWTGGAKVVVALKEPINSAPEFSAQTTARTLPENSGAGVNVVGGVVTATDGDSDTLTYSLTGTDAGSFEIDSNGQISTKAGATHNFNFEAAKNSYSVTANVSDSKDEAGVADTAVDDTITVTINLTNVNEKPEITTIATTASVAENTTAVLTLAAKDEDASDTETWSVESGDDGGKFEISPSGALSFKDAPDFEMPTDVGDTAMNNTYVVTVKVTDAGGLSAMHTVTVTVTDANKPPVIAPTPVATSSPENSTAAYTFAATDDDASDTLRWSVESDDDGGKFDIDSSTGALTFKTAPDFEMPTDEGAGRRNNTYLVGVTVTDDGTPAMSALRYITIEVTNVNEAPEITTIATTAQVAENTTAVLTLAASDVDASDTETWSVGSGDDGGKFEISPSGALSFKNAPDFEMPSQSGSTDNAYVVTVKVTDVGGLSDMHTVTVTVTDANDAPEITTTSTTHTDFEVDENTATTRVIKTYEASDVDADTTLTWSVEGTDADDFLITKNAFGAGQLRFVNVPNFEMPADDDTMNDYNVTVKVQDNGSPRMSAMHAVTVRVTNVNEAPEITTTATTATAAENSTAVLTLAASDVDASTTFAWSVEPADDGGKFDINSSTGALSFKDAPDFETPTDVGDTAMNNTYVVTVKVQDNGSPRMSDTHTVTVTVTNINEAPEITTISTTHTDFNVDENTPTSDVIKTYEATDADATTTLTWSLEGNDAGDFTITKNAQGHGQLKFADVPNFEMPVDADTMNDYDIRVKVRDNGIPGNRGSSNQLDDTVSVVVNVLDVNEAPVVSGTAAPSFMEIEYDATFPDLTIGTYTYTDEDRNPSDTIAWALTGTDATHFNIGSASGVLSFKMRPDFENPFGLDNVYLIKVEADDGQGEIGTFDVSVIVTNVDETPEITTTAASHTAPSFMEIEYDATTADLMVADYDGRDEEDNQNITWSKAGADAADFTIDRSTGVLSFVQRPNFEMPADAGEDNVYNVTVRATDTTSPLKTREIEVTVTVSDVNERPDIDEDTVPSYMEIEYDSTGTRPDVHTFTATDYDDMDTVEWSLLGTDAAHLEIGATSGVLTFRQDSGFGHGPLPSFEHPRDDDGDGSSNTYTITVRASDDDATDQKSTDYAVVVTVTDVNEAPEFSGTPETAITPDEHDANDDYVVMDLADYDARDEEGGVSWSLTGTDRLDFAISADGVVTFAETPNYEAPEDSGGDNTYEFTVVATDLQSGSSRRSISQAVTVTVGDVEEAGALTVDNLSPAAGQTLTFKLTDPDGGIDASTEANISWDVESMVPGGSWATVGGVVSPTSTTLTYTVDENDTGKALRAVVTYRDRRGPGKMAASEATAAVTADPIPNAPPRFRGGSTWSVEEGPAGRNVGFPISATDRDNDPLTYGIQASQDSALFEVDPSSGQVRTVEALDFETTTGFLLVTITLHDGKGVEDQGTTNTADDTAVNDDSIDHTQTATVRVTDVEEDGVVTLSDDEPGVGTALTATLEDGDGGVTGSMWQWARSANGQTGWTNVSGATSSSYTTTQADAEFFLRATVTYTDRRGSGKSAEANTSQRVFGENQRPTFPSTETGQRTVPENTRARVSIGAPVEAADPEDGGLTYSLSGTDAAAFTIVETTGQIRVKDALDFEMKSSYSVTVEVHDSLDGLGSTSTTVDDTQAVAITVENVEEPGVVTLTTATGTIQARAAVTAALSDDDGPSGVTWQWSRSRDRRTDWVNIAGATSSTYTPTIEEDRGNYLRATASYSDGRGPNKTAEQVSARVGDPPPVNSAPVFPATEDGQREVEENAAGGTAVGAAVEATDLNAGDSAVNDPLVYSLAGTDAASFAIDSGTGQLRVAPGVQLDFEGKRTYRVTVEVTDGRDQNGDDDLAAIDARQSVTITLTNVNEAPVVTGEATVSYQEDANRAIATYTGTDPERGALTWSVSDDDFWISSRGQLYFRTPPSFEGQTAYQVTVTTTDDDANNALSSSLSVTITVTDAEEAGTVTIEPPRGWDGTTFQAGLNDDDGGITGEMWRWERSSNQSSGEVISGATSSTYTATSDDVDRYLRVTVSYEDDRGSGKEASAALTGRIEDSADRPTSNNVPAFTATVPVTRSLGQGTSAGRAVGAPVRATDEDLDEVLTYSLSGQNAGLFSIDPASGQLRTKGVLDYDPEGQNTYTVTVNVHDGFDAGYSPSTAPDATIDVTITVTAAPTAGGGGFGGGGGGGGGGGDGPSPSAVDFEWTVKHDIESLDSTHDSPTGAWADGATLWLLENGDGADDAIYAYDLETGERVEEREFELDERNRAPRGVWSDGKVLWVSDSGQNKLFAYDLESGEHLPQRDVALAERNRDARGIWSDGATMWVLDGGKDSLFAYDLESGELLAECALDAANGDPRGIWSDGVTVWVSDDGAKRLFAYRLPVLPDNEADSAEDDAEDDAEDGAKELERVRDEEFDKLSGASNNSPRGIWSDGEVMYVADESDDKVYTYNIPDAIDARLASLSLSGVAIGEFDPGRTDYVGIVAEGVTEATVEAGTVQRRTKVAINPPDANEQADGHQIALHDFDEISVTVTSADRSRTKVYRVSLGQPVAKIALDAGWNSFAWPGANGTAVVDALREGGITDTAIVVYEWDEAARTWKGFFPDLEDVPGLNTLTALKRGGTYWVAVREPVTWTLPNTDPSLN